jgi:hypothetical protein
MQVVFDHDGERFGHIFHFVLFLSKYACDLFLHSELVTILAVACLQDLLLHNLNFITCLVLPWSSSTMNNFGQWCFIS